MFDDIGKKIKLLAKITSIALMVVVGIIGIIIMANSEEKIWLGIIVIVVGCAMGWISGFVLYGYGELIDKTCDNNELLSEMNYKLNKVANSVKKIKNDNTDMSYDKEEDKKTQELRKKYGIND